MSKKFFVALTAIAVATGAVLTAVGYFKLRKQTKACNTLLVNTISKITVFLKEDGDKLSQDKKAELEMIRQDMFDLVKRLDESVQHLVEDPEPIHNMVSSAIAIMAQVQTPEAAM